MNLEVFKTMESALKQDLVCLPLTSLREEKGMAEDEMVGQHHGLNGHEFE